MDMFNALEGNWLQSLIQIITSILKKTKSG